MQKLHEELYRWLKLEENSSKFENNRIEISLDEMKIVISKPKLKKHEFYSDMIVLETIIESDVREERVLNLIETANRTEEIGTFFYNNNTKKIAYRTVTHYNELQILQLALELISLHKGRLNAFRRFDSLE
jgi:hypothetical protein